MAHDWERQAELEELTERITDGEFAGDYDALKRALDRVEVLDERDQQQLLQYWMSREREASRLDRRQ